MSDYAYSDELIATCEKELRDTEMFVEIAGAKIRDKREHLRDLLRKKESIQRALRQLKQHAPREPKP